MVNDFQIHKQGFPVDFVTHLPKKKSLLTLVDEDGKETGTTYLPHHKELRGGWRHFSNEHHLADGDALVFQLIKEKTLKVINIFLNGWFSCTCQKV